MVTAMSNRLRNVAQETESSNTTSEREHDFPAQKTEPRQGPLKTIDDIAQALGVAKSTVSRALSGKGRISTETRERIRSFIEKEGFQINRIAKSLAESRTYNIAVTMPTDTEVQEIPFFQACLRAIAESLSRSDYDTVVAVTTEHDIASLKRLVRHHKVDGVIHTRPLIKDRTIDFLKESSFPFVVIGSVSDPSVVQVDSDHWGACKSATLHLLRQGLVRQVLLAGSPHHQVNKNRYEGYRSALTEWGIQQIEETTSLHSTKGENLKNFQGPLVFWNATTKTSIDEILRQVIPLSPSCIIGMDDVITGRILQWLHRHRLAVPEEVAVASFHDSAVMEQHLPPISAVHVEIHKLGSLAATLLIDMIEGKEVEPIHQLEAEFIIRESSRKGEEKP